MLQQIFENIEILDAGSEGKAVARVNEQVIFVPFVVPGDIVDLVVTRKKRNYLEGKAIRINKFSDIREEPVCEHFGICGGCRWQNIRYQNQLHYKQKQVSDNIQRIGKIHNPLILPIIPSKQTIFYRNKLEYTFSNRRWMVEKKTTEESIPNEFDALGFHLPQMFDRVLDIHKCWLQADPSNAIRLEAKRYSIEHNLTFYDAKNWTGFMRNLLIRNSPSGELMIILVFNGPEMKVIQGLLDHLIKIFPQITSLYFVINEKKNDVISDLPCHLYKGGPQIKETIVSLKGDRTLEFGIGPLSFYQTNSDQVSTLYKVAGEFADLQGAETVYDLYTGIGTIASFVASSAGKVIGIESIASAVENARENATLNNIQNTSFHAGETEKILTSDFIRIHGKPDVIITDPPRSGMHEKVIRTILEAAPEKVVYVSCNPATQARDIDLMKDLYTLEKCQPVDMFPHTHHVENVALMKKKN